MKEKKKLKYKILYKGMLEDIYYPEKFYEEYIVEADTFIDALKEYRKLHDAPWWFNDYERIKSIELLEE